MSAAAVPLFRRRYDSKDAEKHDAHNANSPYPQTAVRRSDLTSPISDGCLKYIINEGGVSGEYLSIFVITFLEEFNRKSMAI